MTEHKSGMLDTLGGNSADSMKALLSVLDALPELAFILSADGDYLEIFGARESLMVRSSKELLGKNVFDVMPKEKAEFIVGNIRKALNEERNISVEYELEVAQGVCSFEAGIAPLTELKYHKPAVIWFARDVTLQKKEKERLYQLAHNDALTGLPNRRLLEQRLEEENSRCQRHKQYSALLFIDLDDFKPINDRYGHEAGDLVLVHVARILNKLIRKEDFVCRLAGDEFVVILSFVGSEKLSAQNNALTSAEHLLKSLKEPISFNGVDLTISASIGLSFLPIAELIPKVVINKADRAMYRAKSEGKSCISCCYLDTPNGGIMD